MARSVKQAKKAKPKYKGYLSRPRIDSQIRPRNMCIDRVLVRRDAFC
jgi:hypothetical protein